MKALKLAFVAVAGLASMATHAADITLNPSFGQNAPYNYNVCDLDPGTTAGTCPDLVGATTTFTVLFTTAGLLNSSGSTSSSPTSPPDAFTKFSYIIKDPNGFKVADGTPQDPAQIAVIAGGTYTFEVTWEVSQAKGTVTSANWQVVLTTSPTRQVPEPGTLALLGLGLVGLGAARRRKA